MRNTFDTFVPATKSQERALRVARKVSRLATSLYATEAVNTPPAIVFFSGRTGVGKTHLFDAIRDDLDENGVDYDAFTSAIPYFGAERTTKRVILGDDAFSRHTELDGRAIASSWSELTSLNNHILSDWYPRGSLLVLTSNFDLVTIQEQLRVTDTVGRASSRLDEMLRRGANVPIEGTDYRSLGEIESLFE